MKRRNRHVTDMKWNTKKRLLSMRRKLQEIAADWGDTDFFISSQIDDELIGKLDEIIKEINGVDVTNH